MSDLSKQFTQIFEQYTKGLIADHIGHDLQARALWYTIEFGKNRFRAGLSYFLSGENRRGIVVGAVAEIAWAAILILDDIGDRTLVRRGRRTAWKKFGLLEASHAAVLGITLAESLLEQERMAKILIKTFRKSIDCTLRAQIEQKNFMHHTSTEIILDNYARKTALGRWPIEASVLNDHNILNSLEKMKIKQFAEAVAIPAQIKNDLDDFGLGGEDREYEESMKDLQEEVLNYPVALFWNRALQCDRNEFLNKYWGRKLDEETSSDVKKLFSKYEIFEKCWDEIEKRISSAIALLQGVSTEYKLLLEKWAYSYLEKP